MTEQKGERRRDVRLTSKKSGAGAFKCGNCSALPPQALVADVSESGVHLLFDWPDGAAFPLQVGDGMGFHLKVEGADEGFELWSIVRRVGGSDQRGRVGVGVEFTGLDPEARSAIQKALLSLAMTRLRTWHSDRGPEDVKAPAAPEGASRRKKFSERMKADPPAAPPEAPAAPPAPRRKLFLGEILVKQGALDPERFGRFLAGEFTGNRPMGQELLEHGLTTEAAIARALAEQARLPYADPATTSPDAALIASLPRRVLLEHRCVPIGEESGAVVLAMSSPPDLKKLEALREGLGRRVRVRIVPEPELAKWRKHVFNEDEEAATDSALRFPAQLRVEYRFMDRARVAAVDRQPSFGLTREIWAHGLTLAGPLPKGVTPDRIGAEGLVLSVAVDCPSLSLPMHLGCTPLKIEAGKVGGEHLISCRIDDFPDRGELSWARVCMVHGTHRFRPQALSR